MSCIEALTRGGVSEWRVHYFVKVVKHPLLSLIVLVENLTNILWGTGCRSPKVVIEVEPV